MNLEQDTATLELEYGQVERLLTGLLRLAGVTYESVSDLFPQASSTEAIIRPYALGAANPVLDYLQAAGIPSPTSADRWAAQAPVTLKLPVVQLQTLAGAASATVQTWDDMLRMIPSFVVQRATVVAWRNEAVEAAAEYLAACRLAGIETY